MLLLLAVDAAIIYWVFVSIVATRRALRLRKNFVKMSLYNHFAYTLIFGILCECVWGGGGGGGGEGG